MKQQINKPKNWEDFEDLCHRLWRSMWGDPNASKNGRPGQNQHGVDVFGKPYYANQYNAVQCKLKNQNYGATLTIESIKKEASNAEFYAQQHGLGDFIVATTSPADANLQNECRKLDQSKKYKFPISIWNWDMIEDEINCRPDVFKEIYGAPLNVDSISELHLGMLDKDDRIYLFFTRPILKENISNSLRMLMSKFFIELKDNSIRHGHATEVVIKYQDHVFEYTDDGDEFDITFLKDHGNGGHKTYRFLLENFHENLEVNYEYTGAKNKLLLRFIDDAMLKEISPVEIVVPSTSVGVFSRQDINMQLCEDIRKIKDSPLPVKIVLLQRVSYSAGNSYLSELLPKCKNRIDSISLPSDGLIKQLEEECKRYGVKYDIR